MRIAVLTSSRADYYIYTPLLERFRADSFFDFGLIVFGSHLSRKSGYTLSEIKKDGHKISRIIHTHPIDDSPLSITDSMGRTISAFGRFWEKENYDLVFALGDRFEMFASVVAGLPSNICVAHIHGGETTLGAIDNVFRHSISLMSSFHFASTEIYRKRIMEICGNKKHCYNVGALSFDNLRCTSLLTPAEFFRIYNVDLSKLTILITIHPETRNFHKTGEFIDEIISAILDLKEFQFIVTMPNSDTSGNVIRKKWCQLKKTQTNKSIFFFENLGKKGYLSAMKHCSLMLGNSSSGFIEASFFPTKFVNIGNRQDGRINPGHIIHCDPKKDEILKAIEKSFTLTLSSTKNIYGDGYTAMRIVNILKSSFTK